MADLFNESISSGNGTLMVQLPDSSVSRIDDIPLDLVKEACPLLYHAFEHSDQFPQASIEAPSTTLVTRFLCYLYTKNDYINPDNDCELRSLLLHAQMYQMAQNFDVPELEVAAHLNFVNATELSCCMPDAPQDLAEAIEFVCSKLANERQLKDTLLNYCVGCYRYHRLGENARFLEVIFENSGFHKDLCQTSLKRDFQDDPDASAEIMRLAVRHPTPYSKANLEKRALGDILFDMFSESEQILPEGETETAQLCTKRRKTDTETGTGFILVHRPKEIAEKAIDSDSSSEEEGFTVVHRPKPPVLGNTHSTTGLSNDDIKEEHNQTEWDDMDLFADDPVERPASPTDSEWSVI